MIVDNKKEAVKPTGKKQIWSWLNLLLTAVLLGVGIWYIAQRVTLAELVKAFAEANIFYILLSLIIVILTLALKSWRWQILLTTSEDKPAFSAVFLAFNLGAYVNLILPFMRMGEIARIFAIDWMAHVSKTRALGTIVVEKLLDLIMLGLLFMLVLPFAIMPAFVHNPLPMITAVSLLSLLLLYLLAFQTKWILTVSRLFARWLPAKWEQRTMRWLVSGLEGLNALHHKRQTLGIISLSVLIGLSSIVGGYLLFQAFHLGLGIIEAAILTIVTILAIAPPTTPGKIGVLNGAVALTLIGFGVRDNAILVSYSTVYYIIIVLPVILFGGLAASQTDWKWEKHPSA